MHLLFQQVLLEVLEVLAHCHALLLTFHEGSKAVGNLDVGAQDAVDFLFELRRVSRLAEDTHLTRTQVVFQGLVAACSVGVEDISSLLVALTHGVGNLFVAIGSTADERRDALVRLCG